MPAIQKHCRSARRKKGMKKRLRVLALYRTAELKENIAGILDNENAFYTTYAFLDSGDICQLSAKKDPDIILLEASADKDGHSTIAYGRELRLRTCAQFLILGPSKDRAAVIETSTQTFASGYVSPEQIPFYTRSSVRHGVGTLRRKF